MSAKAVTIFGTSRVLPGDEIFETARQLGAAFAQAGFTIVNGGYGGTMLAAAKGARSYGGKVIGVTCSAFNRSGANEYITEQIITDSLPQRLARLIELGDGYVVLPGGTGTLLELAEVWELKNKRFIAADKPVILLGSFWQGLVNIIMEQDREALNCLKMVDSVEQAVAAVKKALR